MDYFDSIESAEARRRSAERLLGLSDRMLNAPRSEPFTVVRGSGGMPDIVVANKYGGMADAVNQFGGQLLGYQADRALSDSEQRRKEALSQLLGEVDSGETLDVRRAVALSQLGIDPRVIKSFSPGQSQEKDYLRANLSSIASSPAAIKAAEIAGLITPEQAITLTQEWERGKYTTQVENPTTALGNRLAMNPTDNSVIAAGLPGGAPVAGRTPVTQTQPTQQGGRPNLFVGQTGKPLVWEDTNGNFWGQDLNSGELRKMSDADFAGQQFEIAPDKIPAQGASQPPAPSGLDRFKKSPTQAPAPSAQQPAVNPALEAIIAAEPLSDSRSKRITDLRNEYEALRGTRSEVESAYNLVETAPKEIFGDRARMSQFLTSAGLDAGGTLGEFMQYLGKGLQSPEAAIADQNLLERKLLQMKLLGGSDTEKEFQWLSQNLPSAYSDPRTAQQFLERLVRTLKIAERAKQKRLEDATTRLPGTRRYRDEDPSTAYRDYYGESSREISPPDDADLRGAL